MTTEFDLAAWEKGSRDPVQVASEAKVTAAGTGEAVSGLDVLDSGELVVSVHLRKSSSSGAGPALSVIVEESDDGASWSTLETFAFSASGASSATVATPPAYLRARWSVDAGEWSVSVLFVPAEGNVPGGTDGGSQPYVGPFTVYALQSQAIDASGEKPTTGTLTLSYGGVSSDPIASDANAAAITAALEAIPALEGKILEVTDGGAGWEDPGSGIVYVRLAESLAPFELFEIEDNSLGVADPLIYASGQTTTELVAVSEGDVVEDFVISVPVNAEFGTDSGILFDCLDAGDIDWPNGFPLRLDENDGSETFTGAGNATDQGSARSALVAIAAALGRDDGSYPTLPSVVLTGTGLRLAAEVDRQGQSTNPGYVNVWVKLGAVQAPS